MTYGAALGIPACAARAPDGVTSGGETAARIVVGGRGAAGAPMRRPNGLDIVNIDFSRNRLCQQVNRDDEARLVLHPDQEAPEVLEGSSTNAHQGASLEPRLPMTPPPSRK